MPIYEYECLDCGEKFEDFRRAVDCDREIECPACGSKKTQRVLSVFATGPAGSSCWPTGST